MQRHENVLINTQKTRNNHWQPHSDWFHIHDTSTHTSKWTIWTGPGRCVTSRTLKGKREIFDFLIHSPSQGFSRFHHLLILWFLSRSCSRFTTFWDTNLSNAVSYNHHGYWERFETKLPENPRTCRTDPSRNVWPRRLSGYQGEIFVSVVYQEGSITSMSEFYSSE